MNRLPKYAALLLFLSLPFAPALAAEEMMHGEESSPFHVVRFQIDGAHNHQGGLLTWEGIGSIGGDLEKLVVRSEGEMQNGHVERSEVWGLYSRNVSEFWDVQAGVRQDFDPRPQTFLVVGVEGLAPYFIETGAHAFLAKNGDLSARLEQSIDLLITQSVALKPHLKLDVSANDVPEREIGAGISRVEMGAQLRYEITRKFAPYIDLVYERALGNTARMIRNDGGDPGDLTLRAGVSFWF
ncbi:copper resistance protein B [Parvibaculum sp.]|uniref:copper resistance protein B n=1 Tax=Parvibaculum sp. TaxID=2024848 RepID=UPI003210857B